MTPTATNTIASNTESFANTITSGSSPSTTPLQDPHLVEKIAIPIGTVVGVATIGGVTYLIYKRRNKKLLLISGNRREEKTNNQNESAISEVVRTQQGQEQQAHIEQLPYGMPGSSKK